MGMTPAYNVSQDVPSLKKKSNNIGIYTISIWKGSDPSGRLTDDINATINATTNENNLTVWSQ